MPQNITKDSTTHMGTVMNLVKQTCRWVSCEHSQLQQLIAFEHSEVLYNAYSYQPACLHLSGNVTPLTFTADTFCSNDDICVALNETREGCTLDHVITITLMSLYPF